MVRAVGSIQPLFKILPADGATPQIAVLLGPPRNDSKAAARPGCHRPGAAPLDDARIHFLLGAIAIHGRARRSCDDSTNAMLHRSPNKAVHQRVLERLERRGTA
jgi:hypothetical protein